MYVLHRNLASSNLLWRVVTEQGSPCGTKQQDTPTEDPELNFGGGSCSWKGTKPRLGLLGSLFQAKKAGGTGRRCNEHRSLVLVSYSDLKEKWSKMYQHFRVGLRPFPLLAHPHTPYHSLWMIRAEEPLSGCISSSPN